MSHVRKYLSMTLVAALVLAMAVPGVSAAGASGSDVTAQSFVFWEDAYESDDTTGTAAIVPEVSMHTFHEIGDVDIVKIVAEEGDLFSISTEMLAASNGQNDDDYGDFDILISVFEEDGETQVGEADDNDYFPTYSGSCVWEAPYDGTFFVQVEEYTPDDRGAYRLYLNEGIGHRIYGSDRYATSAAVSHRIYDNANIKGNYENGYSDLYVYDAIVASGQNFADAITGSVLAAAYDAPLYLTKRDSFPASVAEELRRVFSGQSMYFYDNETTVHVVGGEAAIGDGALAGIGMVETVSNVNVIAGADRYETAALVAADVEAEEDVSVAYIVNGSAWADAIAVAAVAPYNDGVILLSKTDMVPQVTLDALTDLGITDVIIVGGEAVVTADAADDLAAVVGGANVERIAGATRYETARLIAEHGVDDAGMTAEAMLLASGETFPDALSAGTMAWWLEAPVLLTRKNVLSGDVVMFMQDYGPIPDLADNDDGARQGVPSYLIGGPGAVSDPVYHEWRGMFFEGP